MSVPFPELKDPRDAFLAKDPRILTPPVFVKPPPLLAPPAPVVPPAETKDPPHLILIGVGIAAAIVGIKMIMSQRMAKESPATPAQAQAIADTIWAGQKSVWRQLALPALVTAYTSGAGLVSVAPDVLEKLAVLYADELGDYIYSTSVAAMVEGFSAQLNGGTNVNTSWIRSTAGYGLDSKQTRSYIITLTDQVKGQYTPEPIPATSLKIIDQMMLTRADRIGQNEAYKATQMGRNMVWSYMQSQGQLAGAKKRWITARDELVCPVCAPLNGVSIPLAQQFESQGQRFYSPGVHPNCRCEIVLDMGMDIVKNQPGDPFDRDEHGHFSTIEQRQGNSIGMKVLPPIGTSVVPIGSSMAPVGSSAGPIGWARAAIGHSLPPIGWSTKPVGLDLPPIGQAPPSAFLEPPRPPQPRIGIEEPIATTSKNPTESKNKTNIKNTIASTASIQSSTQIRTPIKASNDMDTEIDVFHGRPLIVPANNFIRNAHMNNYHFYNDSAKGKFIFLDGGLDLEGYIGESGVPIDLSLANKMAFWRNADAVLPPRIDIDPDIRLEHNPESEEGSVGMNLNKVPQVFFRMERGWVGNVDQDPDAEHPGWGIPKGWYRIDDVDNINADMETTSNWLKAYPESVAEEIESGAGVPGVGGISTSAAAGLTSSVVTVKLIPVKQEQVDQTQILKSAPRLTLKRK